MKKIEIRAKPGRTRKYHLFNSPEALYVWRDAGLTLDEFIAKYEDQQTCIEINGDVDHWIEAEWMGFEVHDNVFMIYVRMARCTPKVNSDGFLLAIYAGWTTSSYLKFSNYEDNDVIVKRITSGKIDLDSAFKD